MTSGGDSSKQRVVSPGQPLAMTGNLLLNVGPLSTQGSVNLPPQHKFYSQTEINEADEDYPEDEVADEIPDAEPVVAVDADTEDE